jgi:hypothetical protein
MDVHSSVAASLPPNAGVEGGARITMACGLPRSANAANMSDANGLTRGSFEYYRDVRKNSGLWSCCGYDGLSVVFLLPLEAVRSLPENQKRGLMGLLTHLGEPGGEDLRSQVGELEDRNAEDRLAGVVRLSTRFSG